jgi:hypothetical protein
VRKIVYFAAFWFVQRKSGWRYGLTSNHRFFALGLARGSRSLSLFTRKTVREGNQTMLSELLMLSPHPKCKRRNLQI